MSDISDALKAARVETKPIIRSDARILILDIERMKGQATVEFWDLGDFKNRRIHADDVTLWPRTICAAWQWYDSKRVEFAAEWEPGGREGMLERTWDAYDRADVVVGHNLAGFDTKKLATEWWLMGLPKPSPFATVDTLKVARQQFGMESNTLDAICKRAGLVAKTDRYDIEVARAALAGHKPSQRRIKAYNVGDIPATRGVYDAVRGWIPNHPHITIAEDIDDITCNECGSRELAANGTTTGPSGRIVYKLWRCGDCGANVKDTRQHARTARTTGAR